MSKKLLKRALIFVVGVGLSMSVSAKGRPSMERLGRLLFKDQSLSYFNNQSCKTCHHPSAQFADPVNAADPFNFPVSLGSDGFSFGGRNAPTAAYAGFIPVFQEIEPGVYSGGMFWDGRATGLELGDPLAEQARGPFLNPVEMAMPDKLSVVNAVAESRYSSLFEAVFPGTDFGNTSPANIDEIYNNIAIAIAKHERSHTFRLFSSLFDDFWAVAKVMGIDVSQIGITIDPADAPQGILNASQLQGLAIFNGKGQCSLCHVTTDFVDGNRNPLPPMFTDFTYDNLGIPKNPVIAQLIGSEQATDYGLGGRPEIAAVDPVVVSDGLGGQVTVSQNQAGKFKVSTLRNIAETAPYGHNGFFATLEDIVHFYNTRDLAGAGWDAPEVVMNLNTTELGNLGLTAQEESNLVEFLKTLSDDK